jgi:hypothetical protein
VVKVLARLGSQITKSDYLEEVLLAASIQARLHNRFFFLCGSHLFPPKPLAGISMPLARTHTGLWVNDRVPEVRAWNEAFPGLEAASPAIELAA